MKAILAFVAREPAMLISIGLALANMLFTLTTDQQLQVSTLLESLILLAGGVAIRANVVPVATVETPGFKP